MPLRDDCGPLRDAWIRVPAGAALAGASILTLADAEERADALGAVPAEALGLHIPADADLGALGAWLSRVALISIDFPGFADGRGFSLARAIRGFGFTGRLRAFGPVISDQYAYLRACGFDEVETTAAVGARQPDAEWKNAAVQMSLGYQRGYGGVRSILDARRAARR